MQRKATVKAIPNWEERVLTDIAVAITHRSQWGTRAGETLSSYFDVDDIFAADYSKAADGTRTASVKSTIRSIVGTVEEVCQKEGIDKIAVVDDPEKGPVGGLWLATILALELDSNLILVRPSKELLAARLKGEPVNYGDNVLLVCDVTTTGGSILEVADILGQYKANLKAVFSIVGRDDLGESYHAFIQSLEESGTRFYLWKSASELLSKLDKK